MASVDLLEKILLCSKYRCVLDEDGKVVTPKSSVYKELSSLLEGKISPKYIYTILLQNRYKLYDKVLNYHNLDKPTNIKLDNTSTDGDESFNLSEKTEKNIEFNLNIPLKTWHDIDCESVIYKSNSKVQRNYQETR